MSLRLLMDEDRLNAQVVAALRRIGFDILTVAEADRLGMSDESHLEFARIEQRILYSANTHDFPGIDRAYVARDVPHAGIILIPDHRLIAIGEEVRRFQGLAGRYSQDDIRGRLLWLSREFSSE